MRPDFHNVEIANTVPRSIGYYAAGCAYYLLCFPRVLRLSSQLVQLHHPGDLITCESRRIDEGRRQVC